MRGKTALLLLVVAVGVLAVPAAGRPANPVLTAVSGVTPDPAHIRTLDAVLARMTADYPSFAKSTPGAQDILDYGIGDLWRAGVDGTGTTIAVIEGWNDPDIGAVVHGFDQRYGLPDPDIQTIYPDGPLPAQCPPGMEALGSYGSCEAWPGELRLDVVAAHLIAPYAKIVISATPADSEITDDQVSQVAPPEMMKAVEYLADHHLADAISISDGSGESTYASGAEITGQDPGPLTAAADGVPVTVATGDCGVLQNLAVASSQCGNTTSTPDTSTWDDSPWVTAVGGSVPNLDPVTGAKVGPDPVWHEGRYGEGAGFSSVYRRPAFQQRVAPATGGDQRSVPDITLDAQDGTSESAPMFAGVLALAAQVNHGPVGSVDDALYQLGPRGAQAGIADVVSGDNAVTSGKTVLVAGFSAGPGFDVASGWGAIDAGAFVPALVAAGRADQGPDSSRRLAARSLAALRHGLHLTSTTVAAGGTSYLSSAGFLPRHPVTLAIDGTTVATLTANALGAVTYQLDPALLGLAAGRHTVELRSLLLTQTASLSTK